MPEFWNGPSQLGSAHTNLLRLMVCASLQSLQVQQPRELHDFLHSVLLSIHIQHPLWIRYGTTDKSNMLKTYGPCNTAINELLANYEPLLHLNPCLLFNQCKIPFDLIGIGALGSTGVIKAIGQLSKGTGKGIFSGVIMLIVGTGFAISAMGQYRCLSTIHNFYRSSGQSGQYWASLTKHARAQLPQQPYDVTVTT